MELKVKDFATFTDPDEKVSYTGRIVGINQKEITFDAKVDWAEELVTMTFPRSEENLFSPARKPKGWVDREPEEPKAKSKSKKKRAAPKQAGGTTKRELVEKLVLDNPKMTRKEHIDLVVKEVGMTPAGASTYVSAARKKLG